MGYIILLDMEILLLVTKCTFKLILFIFCVLLIHVLKSVLPANNVRAPLTGKRFGCLHIFFLVA